ncbi:MAG: biotin/lipoyl-binding protein [Bradyrhizobium sp.]|uniref:HlyD family secretion protein n=1 Tax=Bradyrhizobium sp. TaxID=376 RepID=UPI001EB38AF3|nr:biotin/lipoyl-binding protein [Bradyrhizobium sp.]MBU6458077.1 biotin/lipoyl-binding protein [Bradyrhizobium sp.]MDE2603975.1 HlyD family secretion protein [Bradyrhizobium sp.]
MLELMLCSLFTLVPDYLYRRYVQGKRIGKEITLFSMWHELRWGITGCFMLTILLITMIFYYHPSTTSAALFFRTVPIVPEVPGRVAEVKLGFSAPVKKGDVLFTLDSSKQRAAVETAKRKIAEIDAQLAADKVDVVKAEAQLQQANSDYKQAKDELDVKSDLQRRNPGIVPQRDIDKLRVLVDGRQAAIDAATAARQSAEVQVSTLLPAAKASAEASLDQAQVDLDKTIIRAGVDGRVEQFFLRPGDVVNPLMRPAGVLIPEGAGQRGLQAGFGQIEAQVLKPGMVAEAACSSLPWTIIPMVITSVQDYIAAGQFRGGEQLIDASAAKPGTILTFLEPIDPNGLADVTAGSSCIVNAYTSNHEEISSKDTGAFRGFVLHVIDAVGLVHAMLLRIQALLLPIKTLVLSGH